MKTVADFAAILGLLCLFCGAGAGLLGLSARRGDSGGGRLGPGWCFLLGSAFVGLLLHIPLALEGRIRHWHFWAALAAALALTLWRGVAFARGGGFGGGGVLSSFRALPLAVSIPAGLVLALAISTTTTRLTGWDERAVWGFHARMLYGTGEMRAEDPGDAGRIFSQPRYPLLVPLLEASVLVVQGSSQDILVKLLFAAFFLSLLSVVLSEIDRRLGPKAAGFWGLLLLTVPALVQSGMSGYADVPLAAYATAGVIQITRWLQRPARQNALLAGAFLGAGLLAKQEGFLWVFAVAGAVLWALVRSRAGSAAGIRQELLMAGALVGSCFFVSLAARRGMAPSIYTAPYAGVFRASWLASVRQRPIAIAPYLLGQFFDRGVWGWCWIPFAAGFFLRRRFPPGRDVRFARAVTALMIGGYLAVFVLTPFQFFWHLETAFSRLMLQVYPVALLVLAEQVAANGWPRGLPVRVLAETRIAQDCAPRP